MKKCIKLTLIIMTLTVTALLFTSCGKDESEAKLDYYLLSDDTYMVHIDDSSAGKIIIPETHNGKPVTRLTHDHDAKYPKNATEITIPATIRTFDPTATRALMELPNLCEYEDGVTYVGNWAVACDPDKTEINIREGTVGIASHFINIYAGVPYSLKNLTIPSSVKTIADRSLEQAENLQTVIMPEGVEYIGEWAFSGCKSLTVFYLGDSYNPVQGRREWLYYSQSEPESEREKYWFYFDGHPVPWSEY